MAEGGVELPLQRHVQTNGNYTRKPVGLLRNNVFFQSVTKSVILRLSEWNIKNLFHEFRIINENFPNKINDIDGSRPSKHFHIKQD